MPLSGLFPSFALRPFPLEIYGKSLGHVYDRDRRLDDRRGRAKEGSVYISEDGLLG